MRERGLEPGRHLLGDGGPVVLKEESGPVIDQPKSRSLHQNVWIRRRSIGIQNEPIQPTNLRGPFRRDSRDVRRLEGPSSLEILKAEVFPDARGEEVGQFVVAIVGRRGRGERDDAARRHREAEKIGELSHDDFGDQRGRPLCRTAEFHDELAFVGLHDDGRGTADAIAPQNAAGGRRSEKRQHDLGGFANVKGLAPRGDSHCSVFESTSFEEKGGTQTFMRTRRLQNDPQLAKVESGAQLLFHGTKGTGVAAIQDLLADLGERLTKSVSAKGADGIFGPETDAAVKSFQKKSGLNPDGKVGPKTLDALESRIQKNPSLETPTAEHDLALNRFDETAPASQKRTVYL